MALMISELRQVSIEEIQNLRSNGRTLDHIAQICGVTRQAIHSRIRGAEANLDHPYGKNVCCVCLGSGASKITLTDEIRERPDAGGEVVIPRGRHWIHAKCRKELI